MASEKPKYEFTRFSSYAAPARMDQDGKLAVSRIHKKTDGYLLIRPNGSVRFLSFWEGLQYRFGFKTPEDFV
jgi:hypothetical protein